MRKSKTDATYKPDTDDSDLENESKVWITVSVCISEWNDWFTNRYIPYIYKQ